MTQAPPPPTAADAKRVRTLTRAVARELRRAGGPSLEAAGMAWMEQRPQSLWPLLDAAADAILAKKCDEPLLIACHWLLARQLELIRYRLDRGHDWARAMLDEYQERLIGLVRAHTLPGGDWLGLVNLLRDAQVPIRPDMAEALARAAAEADPAEVPGPGEIQGQLRDLLDGLGRAADDPFMVVEGFAETGTLMPVELRVFLTHELALSSHAMLRETLPLVLLDELPALRQAAAAALEQIAVPETFSPVMLRRCLLARNWVPEPERDAIDRVIRKARLKGVVCAQWAAAPVLEIDGSMVDGSGAQGFVMTTPSGRKGLFAGLLLKQGFGIRDAWCDEDVARREINRSLKETRQEMAWLPVARDYLDTVAQHHVRAALAEGRPPPVMLIRIAEAIGAADWKDRGLDIEAEAIRLFDEMESKPLEGGADSGGAWLVDSPMVQSWYEDEPEVRALVTGRPKPKVETAVRRMLEEILPARRGVWVERLILQALWLRAAPTAGEPAEPWRDCVRLARDLLSGRPMAELPAMVGIAERSIYAARAGGL